MHYINHKTKRVTGHFSDLINTKRHLHHFHFKFYNDCHPEKTSYRALKMWRSPDICNWRCFILLVSASTGNSMHWLRWCVRQCERFPLLTPAGITPLAFFENLSWEEIFLESLTPLVPSFFFDISSWKDNLCWQCSSAEAFPCS